MKKPFIFFFLSALNCISIDLFAQFYCGDQYIYKGDTIFRKSDELFSGEYKEFYPGKVKVNGRVLNGLREGEFTYYAEHNDWYNFGNIDSIIYFVNGKREHESTVFRPIIKIDGREKGMRYRKEYYHNDTLEGKCYYVDYAFQTRLIEEYKKGKLINTQYPVSDTSLLEYSVAILGIKYFDSFQSADTVFFAPHRTVEDLNGIILKKIISSDSLFLIPIRIFANWNIQSDSSTIANDFKIEKFDFDIEDADFWTTNTGNKIPTTWFKKFSDQNALVFFLRNVTIIDQDGHKLKLDPQKFIVTK